VRLDVEEIRRLVREAGYEADTPLAIGVARAGSEPLLVSQGTRADGAPFDCTTVAYCGSLAKQFVGACAVLLVKEGALDVEAPIAEWLPEFPSWAKSVRVRHLLHHTAGLPQEGAIGLRTSIAGFPGRTSEGMLAALATLPLRRAPGTEFEYSNAGYVCLGRIVERIARRRLADLARERIFEPLDMRSSLFWSGPEPYPPGSADPGFQGPPTSVGDGGLWTTVVDLLRWNRAMLEDELGVSTLLHTPGALDDGTPLEYGWGVGVVHLDGALLHRHSGRWENAMAQLVRAPERGTSRALLGLAPFDERERTLGDSLRAVLLRAQ
jgi:CubicO group peptidase (beta-lactamase class C family)